MFPKLPFKLTAPKPRHIDYPKEINTVIDELKAKIYDLNLSRREVTEILGVNKDFINENIKEDKKYTIYFLHKVFLFLGYIPKTLNLNENILKDRLFAYRIRNAFAYQAVGQKLGLDQSTIFKIEKGKKCGSLTLKKLENSLDLNKKNNYNKKPNFNFALNF